MLLVEDLQASERQMQPELDGATPPLRKFKLDLFVAHLHINCTTPTILM